jgi:hypothetical protein
VSKRVSASKTGILMACLYPMRPDVEWAETSSAYASLGSELHGVFESAAQAGGIDVSQCPAPMQGYIKAWSEWFATRPQAERLYELPMAWDPTTDTARVLPSRGARDYSHAVGDEFTGTADLVEVINGRVEVTDYKTGFEAVEPDTWQMKLLALAAARHFGVTEVTSRILQVSDTGVDDNAMTFDLFDLISISEDLRALSARIKTSHDAAPVPGPHCRYCPAKLGCPATEEPANELVSAIELVPSHRLTMAITDAGHAAWTVGAIQRVEDLLDEIKKRVRQYAEETGGIPLGDGKVWRKVSYSKSNVDKTALAELARKHGANDTEIEACTKQAFVEQYRSMNAEPKRRKK